MLSFLIHRVDRGYFATFPVFNNFAELYKLEVTLMNGNLTHITLDQDL